MQKEADENNSAGFFNSLKEMYGPQAKISNAILSDDGTEVITEPSQLIGRWREYFNGLLNAVATTDEDILRNIQPFPAQRDLDAAPTLEEVEIAIRKTKMGKSPGIDGIPPEVYKFGGEELTRRLHQLIVKCWEERTVLQEFTHPTNL